MKVDSNGSLVKTHPLSWSRIRVGDKLPALQDLAPGSGVGENQFVTSFLTNGATKITTGKAIAQDGIYAVIQVPR